MAENAGIPPTWFKFDWPLKEVPGAPVPSRADYSTEKCSWLHEMFASILGKDPWELKLRYENNTPDDRNDDIEVEYSGGGNWDAWVEEHREKSPEQLRYEVAAKNSAILKRYEQASPAQIQFFQPLS